MPARSTVFQGIVHAVRAQTASEGVTVTESKALRDAVLGVDREVDVVIEGTFDGDPSVTSIEVVERSRKADLSWVEQMIAKHRNLPTTQLLLVSESGFTAAALQKAEADGGSARCLTPEVLEGDGAPDVTELFVEGTHATVRRCSLLLDTGGPRWSLLRDPFTDLTVHTSFGLEVGIVSELAAMVNQLPWIRQAIFETAHDHVDRENIYGYEFLVSIAEAGYHLRNDDLGGELHQISQIVVGGDLSWRQAKVDLGAYALGGRAYRSGVVTLMDQPTAFVATHGPEVGTATVSWRRHGSAPHPPGDIASRFAALHAVPEQPLATVEPGEPGLSTS